MRPQLKTLVLTLCLLAPLPGFAQDDRDARLAAAKDYVAATLADLNMPKIIKQMWEPLVPQIEGSIGKPLTPEQLTKIDTLYQETYSTKMVEIMTAQDEIMADVLTLPEIEALRDFYKTEAGSAVMRKLPDIIAKQQPQIIEMVQTTMPEVMPKLQAIVAGQ